LVAPSETHAQIDTPSLFERAYTLEGWAQQERLFVLDQRHALENRLYDRGMFRHITPKMDREYSLDMLLYQFTVEELSRWSEAENSIHVRLGSIGRDLFAFYSHLHSRVRLAEHHDLEINAVIQQDGRADRAFLEVGYSWQVADRHAIGVEHTLSEYKPDLDLSARYEFQDRRFGRASAYLTIQDVYNNFIYNQLGITPDRRQIIRSFSDLPYFFSLSLDSPDRYALRGELAAGIQPLNRIDYWSQTDEAYRYFDEERLRYLGALVEYRHRLLTTGMFYKHDRSWVRRKGTGSEMTSDYTSVQEFNRLGAYIAARIWKFHGTARAFTGSYTDQQQGANYSESLIPMAVDYDEGQRGLQVRVLYESRRGPFGGLEYVAFQRSYDDNISILARNWTKQWWVLGPSNYRLVGLIGYRFSQGRILAGIGYDLDGDPVAHEDLGLRRFDNGFGRLVLTW
jgi:hypothetical protein